MNANDDVACYEKIAGSVLGMPAPRLEQDAGAERRDEPRVANMKQTKQTSFRAMPMGGARSALPS